MRSFLSILTGACALLLLTLPPEAGADFTIVYQTVTGNQKGTATDYYTASKYLHKEGTQDTIYDNGTRRTTTIDHQKKEYWEATYDEFQAGIKAMKERPFSMGNGMNTITKEAAAATGMSQEEVRKRYVDDLKQTRERYAATVKMMRDQLAANAQKLSPEERAQREQIIKQVEEQGKQLTEQMAQMLGLQQKPASATASVAKITKGGTRKIAGYDTQEYIITVEDSSMTYSLWMTTELKSPLEFSALARQDFMKAWGISGMQGATSSPEATKEFEKLQGFTLAMNFTNQMMGNSVVSSREATEVKTGTIPPKTFEIPAGYKKIKSPWAELAAPQRP